MNRSLITDISLPLPIAGSEGNLGLRPYKQGIPYVFGRPYRTR